MTQEDELKAAGAMLKGIREGRGQSQEDVAYEVGMDQSAYSKVERQGPQTIGWTKLLRIAAVLDCTIQVTFKPKSGG